MSETGLNASELKLPPSVVSKVDVARLVNEMERVDNQLTTDAVRAKAGHPDGAQVTYTEQLGAFLEQNSLSLDDERQRSEIIRALRQLKDNVPIIHMTFASYADPESLARLAEWMRTSLHPQAVIAVGLQPALVAGVYLRTPNHVHDLSLRAKLKEGRSVLIDELRAVRPKGGEA